MIKIWVKWNENMVEYFLLRGVKLSTQTDILCQLFKIDDSPERYALFFKENKLFLSDDLIGDDDASPCHLYENGKFELMLAPVHHVDTVLDYLNQESSLKKGLVELKSHLQINNSNFMCEFIKKGGMNILQSIIMETSGNTLSFALNVFELAITNSNFQIDLLSTKIIEKIISLLDHHSINISNPSLKIAIKLTYSKEGYILLISTMVSMNKNNIYSRIINNLNSTDINTQTFSLALINNMISSSESPSEFLDEIEAYSLSNILKKQLSSTDAHFRKQIYRLQTLKVQEFIRDCSTQYSKEEPTHERLLEKLWNVMFEGEKFQTVDERWKSIGFQGKDPSTDFRGMGIAGLKHLLYMATHHLDKFRPITKNQLDHQTSQQDHYYPVAVCGIHITSILLELMKPSPLYDDNIIPLLFDHKNALEEIYCITLEIFDMVWLEGCAKYMDFAKVISVLKSQIMETFVKATSVSEFKANNFVKKKLIDYKKLIDPKKNNNTRHSKSFNTNYEDKRNFDSQIYNASPMFSRSNDSQHDLLSKSYSTEECHDFDNTHIVLSSLDGNTPLHSSISSHSFEGVSQLLANGYQHQVNHPNSQGMTPLNLACTTSTVQIIELVLQHGINVTVPAKNGYHPIHSLASRRWLADDFNRVLKLLLDKGAEIDTKIQDTMDTPLHVAVNKECEENVKILLGFGSSPNAFNKKGETPLHIAIHKRNKDIIELLIKYGADVFINNAHTSESCEELASCDQEILNLIRMYRDRQINNNNYGGSILNGNGIMNGNGSVSSISSSIGSIGSSSSYSKGLPPIPDEMTMGIGGSIKKPAPLPKRPSISGKEGSGSSGAPSISICSPASSNRSISPTPPTSPSVTSPSIKSTTPIRHTNSAIGLHYESPSSSPTSPLVPSARPSSTNLVNSPPDLNIGSNSSSGASSIGSSSSGGGTLMNLFGRASGSLRSSGIQISPSSGNNSTSPNIKQLDQTKKKLIDALSNIDLMYVTNDSKLQKETTKRTIETLKICIDNLKNLKSK